MLRSEEIYLEADRIMAAVDAAESAFRQLPEVEHAAVDLHHHIGSDEETMASEAKTARDVQMERVQRLYDAAASAAGEKPGGASLAGLAKFREISEHRRAEGNVERERENAEVEAERLAELAPDGDGGDGV